MQLNRSIPGLDLQSIFGETSNNLSNYSNLLNGLLDDIFDFSSQNLTSSVTRKATAVAAVTDDFRDSLTDTTASLGSLSAGGTVSGRVEISGDRDIFKIDLVAGHTYTFDMKTASSGGLSDTYLRLLNTSGVLAQNDDFGGTRNSQITFTATTSGSYYLEASGYSTRTGNYTLVAKDTTPIPSEGDFNIEIAFNGDARYAAVFEEAAQRWEAVITGDLPDVVSSIYGAIDDLLINASAVAIDGKGNILGQAGPNEYRSGSVLPTHGIMEFDSADLAGMEANGTLLDVIVHEMGHVLGLGTLWQYLGLVEDTYEYIGENALAEYRALTGNPNASFVPLEQTGEAGTRGGHWAENIFGSELMTGYAGGAMELSRVTIGSLEDMGYEVDYSAADAYQLPSSLQHLNSNADLLLV